MGLEFQSSAGKVPTKNISISSKSVKDANDKRITLDTPPTKFTWPMGDCDSKETIKVFMPLNIIQNESSDGGNVKIVWERNSENGSNCEASFGLYHGETSAASVKREKEEETERNKESTKRAKFEQ